MKAYIWVHAHSNGDGSYGAKVFATREQAQAYAAAEFEEFDEGDPDGINVIRRELEFDDKGILLNPDVWED